LKSIAVLGCTGSVGRQALNIVRSNRDKFNIVSLSAHGNTGLLAEQIREFSPEYCAVTDENAPKISGSFPHTHIEYGAKYLAEAARYEKADTVLIAVSGFAAFDAVVAAIKAKKRIALANKEVIVCAGGYILELAKEYGAEIIPVDSEHSAIFQCICGQQGKYLKRIILTASGGAVRDLQISELCGVTPDIALKHPNWNMGRKITVDSATMMNKGLEIIEASRLFGVKADNIDCVLHPQSIIHSLAEFDDNSVLAQLSYPDMALPIQYAFTYPQRCKAALKPLNLIDIGKLEFKQIDEKKYPVLKLAYQALKAGGAYPAVLNFANEVAVDLFLNGKILFTDIYKIIEKSLENTDGGINLRPENILYIYERTKNYINGICN
jgi:1-deoxy-D-xylulose-5-phosphate reductoisomerase